MMKPSDKLLDDIWGCRKHYKDDFGNWLFWAGNGPGDTSSDNCWVQLECQIGRRGLSRTIVLARIEIWTGRERGYRAEILAHDYLANEFHIDAPEITTLETKAFKRLPDCMKAIEHFFGCKEIEQ